MSRSKPAAYWDGVAQDWAASRPQRLWRSYSDLLHARLLAKWVPQQKIERILKTDAFDEATGATGLHPQLASVARTVVSIDISLETLRQARSRQAALRAVGADACRLPFDDGAFGLVFSNSTLDHMDSLDDVAMALAELHRVLRPGGQLVLTLDNLRNPVVALRNAVPRGLLARLRLVPYHVGATCGPLRLKRLVCQAGFDPQHVGAMMHCPRLPAVLVANALDRIAAAPAKNAFVRFLLAWERLERWPTRHLTGYFVTVVAFRR
jgi:SAM-dependent methyltransferase